MAGEDILKALIGAQYQTNEDPFGVASQGIAQTMPQLVNPYGSTGRNIAGVAGAGLLAAVLAGVARRDTESQNADLYKQGNQFIAGDQATRDSLVTQNPRLATLGQALAVQNLASQDAIKTHLAETLATKEMTQDPSGNVINMPGAVQALAEQEVAKRKYDPDYNQKQAEKFLDEIRKSPQYKAIQESAPLLAAMGGDVNTNTTAADFGVSDKAARIQNPQSAVRTQTQRMIIDSQPWTEAVKTLPGRLLGGGKFSENYKKQLEEGAIRNIVQQKAALDTLIKNKQAEAAKLGIPLPGDLLETDFPGLSAVLPSGSAAVVGDNGATSTRTLKDGTQIKVRALGNGQYEEVP